MIDNYDKNDKLPSDSNDTTEISDDYLAQFPVTLRKCFENDEDSRKNFAEEIVEKYDEVLVYRAVMYSDKILSKDFLGNAEKYDLDGQKYSKRWAKKYKNHSVSVNESVEELIEKTKFPNNHITGIAKGYMKCKYGPADFERHKMHHNWYLFDGANEKVCKEFDIDREITDRATTAQLNKTN